MFQCFQERSIEEKQLARRLVVDQLWATFCTRQVQPHSRMYISAFQKWQFSSPLAKKSTLRLTKIGSRSYLKFFRQSTRGLTVVINQSDHLQTNIQRRRTFQHQLRYFLSLASLGTFGGTVCGPFARVIDVQAGHLVICMQSIVTNTTVYLWTPRHCYLFPLKPPWQEKFLSGRHQVTLSLFDLAIRDSPVLI